MKYLLLIILFIGFSSQLFSQKQWRKINLDVAGSWCNDRLTIYIDNHLVFDQKAKRYDLSSEFVARRIYYQPKRKKRVKIALIVRLCCCNDSLSSDRNFKYVRTIEFKKTIPVKKENKVGYIQISKNMEYASEEEFSIILNECIKPYRVGIQIVTPKDDYEFEYE